ncbi:MAG: type II toxin-antitoxin system HicA family toxin [Phycisphaerae bacterium]
MSSGGLPVVSGDQAVRAFERAGFRVLPGRGKGSHMVLARDDWPAILTVPSHRELKRGTLRGLIRQSGLTVDEFVNLL